MKKIFLAFFAAAFILPVSVNAQKKGKKSVDEVTAQAIKAGMPEDFNPSIMVIPYVTGETNIRDFVELDVNQRILLVGIREAFDDMLGYSTIDFIARLKAISNNGVFTDDNQSDIKNKVIENAGCDIVIEAELVKTGDNLKIILTGTDSSTGASLGNVVVSSTTYAGMDFGTNVKVAIQQNADVPKFLGTLKTKFYDTIKDGRSIVLNITFAQDSTYDMNTEVGSDGNQLSDEIELWVDDHALNHKYHIQGTTKTQMIFDDIRIPLKDNETGGTFNINRFGMNFLKFMRRLNVSIQRDIKGNTLYVTVK